MTTTNQSGTDCTYKMSDQNDTNLNTYFCICQTDFLPIILIKQIIFHNLGPGSNLSKTDLFQLSFDFQISQVCRM